VQFHSNGRVVLEGSARSLGAEHGKDTLEELFITVAREPLALER
jgi:ABC-2 type transport system ATP-binding protein